MKKIIKLTESDLTRIVKRVINERNLLMEKHSSESINVNIPWMINKEGKEIVAKSQFNVGEYYPSFSYLEGDPDIVKQLDKDTKTNPYTIKSVSLPDVTATPIGPQKFVKGSDGNYYLTGKLQLPQDIKVTWGVVPNTTVVFSDGQSVSGGVVYKKGKQYTPPTQKESDLNRIVKRVMNERNYLMEDNKGHTGQVIDIMLPWTKNETGAVIPARNAFTKPEYISTFSYYVGGLESKAIKDNGNKPVSQITKIVDNITGTEIPTYGTQTYDPATNTIRGKVVPPSDPKNKYSWDATKTSNYSVTFQDGGVINPISVKYKQGKQYIPTQKESDLRRIVKRVMNERRYLMEAEDTSKLEPAITNWINAMNAVYGTQMKLGKSGNNVNITGGVRDIFLYALPLTFPNDKAKIYPRITSGFKTIKSDMAGEDPNKKLLFMTCIPKLASSGGKVPQGCETVMKDTSIITKANAMNTAYDNLVRLVTPAQ